MLQLMIIKGPLKKYDKIHIVFVKASGNMRALQMMKTIETKKGPRRYIKHRVPRATESIVRIVPSIHSGAATYKTKKYTFGSSKVAITTGPLGLQHELITQKFAANTLQITSIIIPMPKSQHAKACSSTNNTQKSCHQHLKTLQQSNNALSQ